MTSSWYSVFVIRIFTIKKYLHSVAVGMHIIAIFAHLVNYIYISLLWVFIKLLCWTVASGKGFNVYTENLMWNQQEKKNHRQVNSYHSLYLKSFWRWIIAKLMISLRNIQVYSRPAFKMNINHAQNTKLYACYTSLLCIKICQIIRFSLIDEIVVFIDFLSLLGLFYIFI